MGSWEGGAWRCPREVGKWAESGDLGGGAWRCPRKVGKWAESGATGVGGQETLKRSGEVGKWGSGQKEETWEWEGLKAPQGSWEVERWAESGELGGRGLEMP